MPFVPTESLQVLRTARERYGKRIWSRYGFADAFNPASGWVSRNHLAINTGITLMMAENARTGFVWKTFMSCPEAVAGLKAAGFRKLDANDLKSVHTSLESPAPAEETSGRGK